MKYSDIRRSIVAQFRKTNQIAYLLTSQPGSGKSALVRDIGADPDLKFDKVVIFNAALRDPVDVMGTPRNDGEQTVWVPPKELYSLRTGKNLLMIEELTDCAVPMQNALCCLIYDRQLNDLKFSDETYIIASGNRTQDKSGATRLTTKLGNRMRIKEFDVSLDDWCEWAFNVGISPILIQFLRFKPNLLSDFSPDRPTSATPRAWERVNMIPDDLPAELFLDEVAGDVGSGPAAEFTAFRKIYMNLPDIDTILMKPDKADVPKDPAVMYALTGAIAYKVSEDNFDRVTKYIFRIPADFQVMCVNDALKLCPKIKTTKAFTEFAVKNANLMI